MRTSLKGKKLSRAQTSTLIQTAKQMFLLRALQERAVEVQDRALFFDWKTTWSALVATFADHDEPLKRKLQKVADMFQVEDPPEWRNG
jgi:hypothetical protein